jgi:predicted DNA-binding mobile mystery protein A
MTRARRAAQARFNLDKRFKAMLPVTRFTPPVRGWVKAVREALGMSTVQLAKRLRVRQPSVTALEKSEARGAVELATLRRAAQALDCTLVYALVPNKPLDVVVRARARLYARRRLDPIRHSMALENQRVTAKESEVRLDEILRETNPRLFWD